MTIASLLRRCAIVAIGALQLAACGGSNGSVVPQTGSQANAGVQVRFVNASPDAAYVDPLNASLGAPLNTSYVVIDGIQTVTLQAGPAYVSTPGFNGVAPIASASSYMTLPSGSKSVSYVPTVNVPGSAGSVGPFTLPAFTNGHRYSVVLTGSYCLHTLGISVFDDGTPGTSGTVAVYDVAPDATASYDFGFFNATDTSGASNHMAGTVARGQRAAVPAPTSASGFGVYVGSGTSASVGTVLPSVIDTFDTANVVPYNALTTLSVFITDTPQKNFGGIIQCSNESFGAANIAAALGP